MGQGRCSVAIRCSRAAAGGSDRKSTRLNSSHLVISYAVFCLKKKTTIIRRGLRPAWSLLELVEKVEYRGIRLRQRQPGDPADREQNPDNQQRFHHVEPVVEMPNHVNQASCDERRWSPSGRQ